MCYMLTCVRYVEILILNKMIELTQFHYPFHLPPVSAAMNPPTGKRLTTHSRFEQVSPRLLCICGFAPEMIPISYPIRWHKNIDCLSTKKFLKFWQLSNMTYKPLFLTEKESSYRRNTRCGIHYGRRWHVITRCCAWVFTGSAPCKTLTYNRNIF